MRPYYEQGGITIYHGDCREVLPTLEAGSVDLVLTDPPYGVGYDLGNDSDRPSNADAICGLLDACGGSSLLAFGILQSYPLMQWDWRWALIWHKPMMRATPAWGIARHYEVIHWYTRGKEYVKPCRTISDVLEANPPIFRVNPETVRHPSQKPVKLIRYLLAAWGGDGLILDPFMGSGTTLRAAKDLNRRAIGIEIEERYCEIAARRLSQQAMVLEAV